MKELPPDPKPWLPPPERWYDRHRHGAKEPAARTITAMRLTVFDRLGIAATGNYVVPVPALELFDQCLRWYGDDIMTAWRELCAGLTRQHDDNVDRLFMTALSEMAKRRSVAR